jgi:hypothetical protein
LSEGNKFKKEISYYMDVSVKIVAPKISKFWNLASAGYFADPFAASSIMSATSLGCDTYTTWLDPMPIVES